MKFRHRIAVTTSRAAPRGLALPTSAAQAALVTRTKAGAEPTTKGEKITVTTELAAADRKADGYTGYTGRTLKVQFRIKNGELSL